MCITKIKTQPDSLRQSTFQLIQPLAWSSADQDTNLEKSVQSMQEGAISDPKNLVQVLMLQIMKMKRRVVSGSQQLTQTSEIYMTQLIQRGEIKKTSTLSICICTYNAN